MYIKGVPSWSRLHYLNVLTLYNAGRKHISLYTYPS